MTTAGSKKLIAALSFILLLQFTCFSAAFAQHLNAPPAKMNLHPKVSSYLQKLEKEYKEGVSADKLVAQGMITRSFAGDRITVYLMSAPGSRIDEAALSDMGAEITKRSGNTIRAQVPVNMLTAVADSVSGISFMKTPDTIIPTAVESEGANLTAADILGTNVVKVDCTGSGCVSSSFSSETDSHGTAVAEIVHDMAPGAQLYLIKVSDAMDLIDAKNYAIDHGIDIINLSGGYLNQNFYDGQCWSDNAICTANDAYNNNILWVNAAGNEAQRHYEAEFSDPDGNGWHNVSGNNQFISLQAKAGDTIDVYLTWDAWPTTDQDYDLYLYNSSNTVVDTSTNSQTGTQPPTERISFQVPKGGSGTYYLAIKKINTTSDHTLDLYSAYHDVSPSVASSSLLNPADAASVLSVGAINYNDWTTGPQEPFSSQGPTTDGRIKPDIMGPDHVSNSIEGIFVGTSASSPHVAGAAALILQKNSGSSVDQLMNLLTSTAINMGSPIPNNIYGYGRLNPDPNAAIDYYKAGYDGTGVKVAVIDVGFAGISSTLSTSSGTTSGGGGGCFIATAAYGSYEAPYVMILRKMRDRFLVTNAPGRAFVHLYYTYSPPIANIIAHHNSLKMLVRTGLLPLVGISWLALRTSPLFAFFTLALATLFVFGIIHFTSSKIFQKRRKNLASKAKL